MIQKPNVRDRGGAVALFSRHRAAALCLILMLPVAFPAGSLFGQPTQIGGGQLRIVTNLQAGTTYTVTSSDCGKLLSLSNPANIAVTIPQAGASGLVGGCWIDIQNTGAGTATFTAGSSLVDGGAGFALTTNQGLRLLSNGTGYFTQRGQGSGSGGGGGALSIQSGGAALGPAATLNVVSGTGVSCIPQVNAGVMTFQCNADTSYLASKVNLQGSSNPQICTSSSGSGNIYTAGCASPLTGYSSKQTLFWFADVANTSTTPTLNIDTLGAVTLVRQDGTALALSDIRSGVLYRTWYDGAKIRVVEAGSVAHAIGYTFDGAGSALSAGITKYLTVPYACTIGAWNIAVDTGTATVNTWKAATGTAIPTAANSISASGVSISSGTAIHSTNVADFTTRNVAANDILGFSLSAVSLATQVNFVLECDQ